MKTSMTRNLTMIFSICVYIYYFLEITEITPQNGSEMGGTLITIYGKGFGHVRSEVIVLVGGKFVHISYNV